MHQPSTYKHRVPTITTNLKFNNDEEDWCVTPPPITPPPITPPSVTYTLIAPSHYSTYIEWLTYIISRNQS